MIHYNLINGHCIRTLFIVVLHKIERLKCFDTVMGKMMFVLRSLCMYLTVFISA